MRLPASCMRVTASQIILKAQQRTLHHDGALADAGREVLRMYARLRGVAVASREALAERLLQRLGLARYADR